MSLTITKVTCPSDKISVKCPYTMTPTGITIHNTANDASAMSEISYMLSNNNQVSYHYAVDDTRAVQGIDLNRNAWHAGDGANGTGNRKTIAIEICYSKSGGDKYNKAVQNAYILVAMLMKQYGFKTTQIYYHQSWSGKYCPHRLLNSGVTLAKYRTNAQNTYDDLYVPKVATGVEAYSGYIQVIYDGLSYRNKPSWEDSAIAGTVKKGTILTVIGRIKVDGVYMYQTKAGWYITSATQYVKYSKTNNFTSTTTTTATKTLKVGSKVKIKSSATKYATGQTIPSTYKNKTYTIQQISGTKALIKELVSWVYTKDLTVL